MQSTENNQVSRLVRDCDDASLPLFGNKYRWKWKVPSAEDHVCIYIEYASYFDPDENKP